MFRMSVCAIVLLAAALGLAACAGRPSDTKSVTEASATAVVHTPLLNLLDCPSNTCPVLEDLHDGDKVVVLTVVPGGWSQVRSVASGKEGFVLTRFLGH